MAPGMVVTAYCSGYRLIIVQIPRHSLHCAPDAHRITHLRKKTTMLSLLKRGIQVAMKVHDRTFKMPEGVVSVGSTGHRPLHTLG